jgi:hypothetical protein
MVGMAASSRRTGAESIGFDPHRRIGYERAMGKIHLNRDRQNLGQFTPEAVSEGLASGRFRPTDLAWREGMETWQPLSTFTDLPPPPVEEPAEPELPPPLAPVVEAFPWERRGELGFFSALWATLSQALGAPQKLFAKLPQAPSLFAAYAFFLILAIPSFAIYSAEMLVFLGYFFASVEANPMLASDPETARAVHVFQQVGMLGIGLWFGFLVFVVAPCVPFVLAGIHHLLLTLFGGARESFVATFAATCYAFGAASPLAIIPLPCCGNIAVVVWGMISLSIGLSVIHRTEGWRAALAVTIPFVLCCAGYLGLNLLSAMSGFSGAGMPQ